MELKTLDLASLHFPKEEWRWLRPFVQLNATLLESPDFFLWAVPVGNQLWAWHPRGTGVTPTAGPTQVRVLILPVDGPAEHHELTAHGLYLRTTFASFPAHDVEWTAAVDVLINRFQYDPAQKGLPRHWPEALKACGLEPHLGILAQRGRYGFLKADERELLFEKRWDLAVFETFEALSPELRTALVQAARKWNLSAAHAKDAINYATILSRKLGDKAALTMLAGDFKSTEEFRLALFRVAQPELARLSEKRIETLRGLRLPPRTSVYGDPSFEKDVLRITHTPRTIGDFETLKMWTADPATTEKIRELLEIYQ